MNFKPILCFATALGAAAMTGAGLQAADPALELVEAAVNDALRVVYDEPANDQPLSVRVRPLLDKYFDFEYATRSAIGPGWRQFSEEQKTRAQQLFTDLVVRTYVDRFEPGPRPGFQFGQPVQPANKRREVPATITYEGQQYSVIYKLRETADGWRMYDIIGEDVSLIANYRAQFDEIFKRGGVEAVLRSLEENLAQASTPQNQ